MLFVFLAVYVALGVGCIAVGVRHRTRSAVVLGIIAVALAAASLVLSIVYALGLSHWTVSLMEALLSPMPDTLLQPYSLVGTSEDSGIPLILITGTELLISLVLWAIPVVGIVLVTRSPRADASA